MASPLQDNMTRIMSKISVMMERHRALLARHRVVEQQLEEKQALIVQLKQQVEQLQHENTYLKLARNIAPTPEGVVHSRKVIAKLVRDIDKCISQLNT